MSVVPQTKATLTVKIVERHDPHFWQSRIKKVAIVVALKNLVPNLTDINVVMEWNGWTGWAITRDLHQWNNENSGAWDKIYPEIKLTDSELRTAFLSTLGNTTFKGHLLKPERAIARLIGEERWTKATWETLKILK